MVEPRTRDPHRTPPSTSPVSAAPDNDSRNRPSSSLPPSSTWPATRPESDGRLRTIAPPIHEQSLTRTSRAGTWLRRIVLAIAVLIPLTILLTMASVYWGAHNDQARKVDAIVILGAAQYNGQPSPVLEARLDHALALWNEGLAPRIVVTGGKMPGDAYTEAETEAAYLIHHGVPESAILYENQGRDTWGSMQGVAAVLKGTGVHSLLIVSDGFHLTRSKLMARHLGFAAYGSPAPDSPIRPWSGEEFSYVVRETGGILAFLPTFVFG
ncbi:MAG: YdcF family protein [Thermomicrobiales bacterium]